MFGTFLKICLSKSHKISEIWQNSKMVKALFLTYHPITNFKWITLFINLANHIETINLKLVWFIKCLKLKIWKALNINKCNRKNHLQ